MGIPTLPITRLIKYSKNQEAVDLFLESGNSEKLITTVDLSEIQNIYEDLITPWIQVARQSLSEIPDSRFKALLEEVPVSFSNYLINNDKN